MRKIQVTLLANEGILVQFKDTKILIDGIHENKSSDFSGLSKQVLNELLEGDKPLFRNIDYIFYTHCHYDHFTAWCNEAFLNKNKVKGWIMPDRQTQELKSLRKIASHQSDQMWLLDLPLGKKQKIQLKENISLTIFRSNHAGKEYADIENFCYLLDFDGRKIFIIGDGEYNAKYFSQMLAGETIDIAFVNPLFLNLRKGREVLTHGLNPKRVVVYHIPFEEEDHIGLRKMVLRSKEKYQGILPPIDILWNELQEITF